MSQQYEQPSTSGRQEGGLQLPEGGLERPVFKAPAPRTSSLGERPRSSDGTVRASPLRPRPTTLSVVLRRA